MNNIWFTSDYHLGHDKIIIHCRRPFDNSSKMDEAIIANHKSLVSENDTVFGLAATVGLSNTR